MYIDFIYICIYGTFFHDLKYIAIIKILEDTFKIRGNISCLSCVISGQLKS